MPTVGDSLEERWSRLNVVVHRASNHMLVTVHHRQKDGQMVWDRRLGAVSVPLPAGSPESSSWLAALQAAVAALSSS